MSRTHVYYLAPTGPGVGLTSVSLGLLHALDRLGTRVGFLKPIAQPGASGPDRSTHFARSSSDLNPPEALPYSSAEALLRQGRESQLLAEVVGRFQQVATGADVVIVERSEEHTSELQSRGHLVCRLLLEKKKRSRRR